MSVAELKQQLHEKIEKETDEAVLNAILDVLGNTERGTQYDTREIYQRAKAKFGHTLAKLAQ